MGQDTDNTALIKAAEDFLTAAKRFDGDPVARADLTKQADNLRWYSEDAGGTLFRQWDAVRACSSSVGLRWLDTLDCRTSYLDQLWCLRQDPQRWQHRLQKARGDCRPRRISRP